MFLQKVLGALSLGGIFSLAALHKGASPETFLAINAIPVCASALRAIFDGHSAYPAVSDESERAQDAASRYIFTELSMEALGAERAYPPLIPSQRDYLARKPATTGAAPAV